MFLNLGDSEPLKEFKKFKKQKQNKIKQNKEDGSPDLLRSTGLFLKGDLFLFQWVSIFIRPRRRETASDSRSVGRVGTQFHHVGLTPDTPSYNKETTLLFPFTPTRKPSTCLHH